MKQDLVDVNNKRFLQQKATEKYKIPRSNLHEHLKQV